MQFIDLKTQYLSYKQEIHQAMCEVLDQGQYILGQEVSHLEKELANFVGIDYAISCASGTDSLQIALMALDIGPGDEVITVPFTWISTAEVIRLVGAKPVFVDIDPQTYNMDVNLLEEAITEKTKAILPVSLFGQMADLQSINCVAQKYGLTVIEDAAQSFGASHRGKKSCSLTRIASTSFFPAKPLGCYGDGGALFTCDEELALKMRAIRNHGASSRHHHQYLGMNSRLDTLQAAILRVKLKYFPREILLRGQLAQVYTQALEKHFTTPVTSSGNTHVYAQYTLRVQEREKLMQHLKEKSIPTAIYYPKCLHQQEVFKDLLYKDGDFPQAEKAALEVLSLPMGPFLSKDDQQRVVSGLLECVSLHACV